MDERLMDNCIGKPVPEWDMARRLPIDKPVSPEVCDTGTVFRINSTYMDVTEPSLHERHWFILGTIFGVAAMGIGPYLSSIAHSDPPAPTRWVVTMDLLGLVASVTFGYWVWKLGRGQFFGLRRRPIRFHRGERKLYAIRKRRFFAKWGEGDVVWEVPWTKDSIFCLHREGTTFGNVVHIRHYTTDGQCTSVAEKSSEDCRNSMKDENNRGVIRLHDKTTHGGEVITACDEIKAMGIPVALKDDMTWCPQCNGHFKILPENSQRNHHGKPVAYHNDPTECGARLISSL